MVLNRLAQQGGFLTAFTEHDSVDELAPYFAKQDS